MADWSCAHCGKSDGIVKKRSGPDGQNTLCNSCGAKWGRSTRGWLHNSLNRRKRSTAVVNATNVPRRTIPEKSPVVTIQKPIDEIHIETLVSLKHCFADREPERTMATAVIPEEIDDELLVLFAQRIKGHSSCELDGAK